MERPEVEKVLLPGTNGDNFPEAFPVGPEKFFKFSILHKGRMPGSEILFPGWLQCLRLVDGQPFQEPAQFLTGQFSGLGRILGPLEASLVKPLLHKDKTVLIKVQGFQRVVFSPAEQINGICVRIHPVSIPDDRHEAIEGLAHIRSPGYKIDLLHPGNIA